MYLYLNKAVYETYVLLLHSYPDSLLYFPNVEMLDLATMGPIPWSVIKTHSAKPTLSQNSGRKNFFSGEWQKK